MKIREYILRTLKRLCSYLRKKQVIIINLFSMIAVLFIGAYIYGFHLHQDPNTAAKEFPSNDEELIIPGPEYKFDGDSRVKSDIADGSDMDDSSHSDEISNSTDVTNIILFGLDRRNPEEKSRSDCMMVVSLDKKNSKIKISSIMRDLYVPIYGKESDRINAAYAYGGAELSIKTINSNLGLDIRNYVAVDFDGLEKVIEKIGGLEIDVKDYEIPHIEGVLEFGPQILNGRQVVDYARIRYAGNADFERTERQRNILNVLYKKIKSQGIAKLPGTVLSLLPYVETSLTKYEIMELAAEIAAYNTDSIEQFRLPVEGHFTSRKIRGMYVLVPDMEANENLLQDFIYGKEN